VGKRKAKRGGVPFSTWNALPIDFLRSRACAQLSPHAVKMFLDLLARLDPGGRGNGDISADPNYLRSRGWTSKATWHAALKELEDAHLICVTRQGGRHKCSLFALTPWPLDCVRSKLDVGQGAYSTRDWERGGTEAPSDTRPAIWRRVRPREVLTPAAGSMGEALPPKRGQSIASVNATAPAGGPIQLKADSCSPPRRGTFSREPSVRPGKTRMGRVLSRIAPDRLKSGYAEARAQVRDAQAGNKAPVNQSTNVT
jgi:hypothetical protein